MKKYLILLIISLLAQISFGQRQEYFGGTRYLDTKFEVEYISDIKYGENLTHKGKKQELLLDIYLPKNDTLKKRPLIVLAYAGAFLVGSKTNGGMKTLATQFAEFGYVVASINYRRGYGKGKTDNEIGKATVLRAMQDMKAAIRFFRKDAATTNLYKIDSDLIISGGASAGAIAALQAAYIKDTVDFPCLDYQKLGGFEGNSGNSGYSSKPQYVVALAGVLGDTAWIDKNDPPLLLMQGNQDYFVPYRHAKIKARPGFWASLVIPHISEVEAFGSLPISQRAKNIGLNHKFYTFENKGHCPFDKFMYPKTYSANEDLVINYMRNFLYNNIQKPKEKITRINISYLGKAYVSEIKKNENIIISLPDKFLKEIKVYVRDGDDEKKYIEKKLKSKNGVYTLKNKLKTGKYILKIRWGEYRTRVYFEIK